MTKKEFASALIALKVAIIYKTIQNDETVSYIDFAVDYGKKLTNKKHLEEVSEIIDWDALDKLIKKLT